MIYGLRTAALYAIMFGIASWLLGKWIEAKYTQIRDYELRFDKAEERIRQMQKELEHSRETADATVARIKVLLIARLSDLSKELSFWRRTMRDLVLQAGGDKRDARELTTAITRSLKTYWASRGEYEADFEALKVAASLVERPKAEERG